MPRSLGALSGFEICGRAHEVRSSGSRQNTRVRDSVSKAGHSTVYRVQHRDGGCGYGPSEVKIDVIKEGSMMVA